MPDKTNEAFDPKDFLAKVGEGKAIRSGLRAGDGALCLSAPQLGFDASPGY